MNFILIFIITLFSQLLLSCSQQTDGTKNKHFFENFHKKDTISKINQNDLNGVWNTQWENHDGYMIHEFIVIDHSKQKSFVCVLNAMGGYEYSPLHMKKNKIFASFIDPDKTLYIDQLGSYGRNHLNVELIYSKDSDTFEWAFPQTQSAKKRSQIYTKLLPEQKSVFNLFQSTCEKFLTQSETINLNELKIEKLFYKEQDAVVSVLQTTKQGDGDSNYCVFNTNEKTVLSLPVKVLPNQSVVFSFLDTMNATDRSELFKPISVANLLRVITPELLTTCSAISKNTRSHLKLKENEADSTYLVCKYQDKQNGSNANWEWGEYPRWEWQNQTPSCYALFSSNCVQLNGAWARNDKGLGAIGSMFIMDSTSDFEADFSRACNTKNQFGANLKHRTYAEYFVANSYTSLNHTVWFKNTRPNFKYDLPFNRIIAFGDSLSDNGNLHTATNGIVVRGGYYQGHFSNGPVWVEYLSKKLDLDLYDWAVGAAPSDLGNGWDRFKSIPYTLQNELENFKISIKEVSLTQEDISKMLFTVLFGGNNFIFDVRSTPEELSNDYISFVDALAHLGAKYIMVINVPDISIAPKFNLDPIQSYVMHAKVKETNQLIQDKLNLYKSRHSSVTFYDANLFDTTVDAVANPSKYHLSNVTDRCYIGNIIDNYDELKICDQSKTYLFWDDVHPTTTFACQVADIGLNIILGKHAIPQIPVDYKTCSEHNFLR